LNGCRYGVPASPLPFCGQRQAARHTRLRPSGYRHAANDERLSHAAIDTRLSGRCLLYLISTHANSLPTYLPTWLPGYLTPSIPPRPLNDARATLMSAQVSSGNIGRRAFERHHRHCCRPTHHQELSGDCA